MFQGCGSDNRKDSDNDSVAEPEEFHADYDIAMTVRSIADAINVDETLDPNLYDFTGILTDGTGRPLYTAAEGMPGEWNVTVCKGDTAKIYPLEEGDLLADDLETYVVNSFNPNMFEIISETQPDKENHFTHTVYASESTILDIKVRSNHHFNHNTTLCMPAISITVYPRKPETIEEPVTAL